MGYTTDFYGEFTLDKPLSEEHLKYLRQFNETRRMKRNPQKVASLLDPVREAAELTMGTEGGYFVGNTDNHGQDKDVSVENYNMPPHGQPGLWCQWVPNDEGTAIIWDEGEKFYCYIEWIEYLINHFLEPWGYKLNGEVYWEGEESGDLGKIVVNDNQVKVFHGEVTYVPEIC